MTEQQAPEHATLGRIPATDLAQNAMGILQRVKAGERLIVTVFGKDVLAIVPLDDLRNLTPSG